MPSIKPQLASALREALRLERAVETGTYRGDGALVLRDVFPTVITIELSENLYREATTRLAAMSGVSVMHGDSATILQRIVEPAAPTLYFLDGHWSGPGTAGAEAHCPLLGELDAIERGHPDDAIVIDDARHFAAPPSIHYPALARVFDLLRSRPDRYVTLIDDQILSVPLRAQAVVDQYGRDLERAYQAALTAQHEARAEAVRRARPRREKVLDTLTGLVRRAS